MVSLMNNTTTIIIESWFIPIDILLIITTALSIILGLTFLSIVFTHKTCWSVPMLLTSNSCLAEVLLSGVLLSMAIFTYQCDLAKNTGNISLCILEGFLVYIVDTMQNYSYLLIAIYRYVTVVYPAQLWWQSSKFQICLIFGKWIFCILFALPLLLTGQIVYNINNQICQIPLSLSLPMSYVTVVLYIIPNLGILIIYIKLARYVRQIGNRTAQNQTLFQARRELRLVQRTFMLASSLIILGIPYMIFVLISFFTTPPKYHFRIAYISADVSVLSIIIMLFSFTQQIREIIQKVLSKTNAVEPITHTFRA